MTSVDDARVAEAADGLYAGPVADFVRARDALVKQARADGDSVLAASLAKLRKPTAGARLANLLVREHREQVEELVGLGAALREAQDELDPDQMRVLGRQRQQVVQALVELGLGSAAALGEPTGPAAAQELGATLTAALVDPDAATQLLTGRLAAGLAYAGLGFGEAAAPATRGRAVAGDRTTGSVRSLGSARARKAAGGGPSAKGAAAATGAAATTTKLSRQQLAADRAAAKAAAAYEAKVDAAERDLAQARLQAAEAQALLDEVTDAISAADTALDDVRARLADAKAAVAALEAEEGQAVEARATAARQQGARTRSAAAAERAAERAARALESLRTKA
jgi:hypothetical protein